MLDTLTQWTIATLVAILVIAWFGRMWLEGWLASRDADEGD